jgi:single-strand DNA-binding protein
MARNLNSVIIQGNICREPEVTYTTGGTAVCELSIASNDSRKNKAGDGYEDIVTYVSVKVWGATAESCGEHLVKGQQITVQGKLRLDEWEKDGVKKYKHWINAEQVFFGPKPKGGKTDDEYSQDPPTQQSRQRGTSSGGSRQPQGQRQRPPADEGDIPF